MFGRSSLWAVFIVLSLCSGPATPAPSTNVADSPQAIAVLPLADSWDWDWDEFSRFWRKQFGKTTGVVGVVSLIVVFGVLIVMSAKKKT